MSAQRKGRKAKTTSSSVSDKYPLLWKFFDGAFKANSGGSAQESDFAEFTEEQMGRAERELKHVNDLLPAYSLGMMADEGYTLHGMTRQEDEDGDDEQHPLLAFELLTTRY